MRVSLIITTYNWPESLILVLKSVENQTIVPEEVVRFLENKDGEPISLIDLFILSLTKF